MRPAVLAACLALLMLAWPVAAQVTPSQPAVAMVGASDEHVIMDAVFWALPGDAATSCLQLPPSRIAITVSAEKIGTPQSIRYHFAPYWYRAADWPPEIDARVTREPRTYEASLAGGRYCYAIANEATPPPDADVTDSPGPAQLVAVRMVLTPRREAGHPAAGRQALASQNGVGRQGAEERP